MGFKRTPSFQFLLVESITIVEMLFDKKCWIEEFALMAFGQLPPHTFLNVYRINRKAHHLTALGTGNEIFLLFF
jgi:hypothetical protein